jgi:hypothetical protein
MIYKGFIENYPAIIKAIVENQVMQIQHCTKTLFALKFFIYIVDLGPYVKLIYSTP